jgi:hypothetical protein
MPSRERTSGIIRVYPDHEAVSKAAAELFVRVANEAIRGYGRFSIALSGGHTFERLHEFLAAPPFNGLVDWGRVHFFWVVTAIYSEKERMYRVTLTAPILSLAASITRLCWLLR